MKLKTRLIGKNIILRKIALSDADSIAEHINDKTIARLTINVPFPYTKKDALIFIRARQNERRTRKSYAFGISLKQNDKIIGGLDLTNIDWEDKKAELGYWIGKRFRGQGLMTEAVNLMLGFGFRELKLHKIYARVFENNLVSMRVIEKNGFRREGILRDEAYKYRRWIDEYYYGLLKSEYKKL